MVTIPTAFVVGFEAFCFLSLTAFGLRVSLFDFICDLAMIRSFVGEMPIGADYSKLGEPRYLFAAHYAILLFRENDPRQRSLSSPATEFEARSHAEQRLPYHDPGSIPRAFAGVGTCFAKGNISCQLAP